MITAAGDKSIKVLYTFNSSQTLKFWRYPYDPKEKITQKVIDQTGKVISSSDPAQQYKVQKEQESRDKKEKYNDSDEEDEYDTKKKGDSRGPLTLLRYQPAMEPTSDNDEEEEKPKPKKKGNQETTKQKETDKKEDSLAKKTDQKGTKKLQPLYDDEDEDDNKESQTKKPSKREVSPKSFLFKSSIDQPKKKSESTEVEERKETLKSKKESHKKEQESLPSKTTQESIVTSKKEETQTNTEDLKVKEDPLGQPLEDASTKSLSKNDDDDKPLDIEELKKKSNYVPLTFQKKGNDSEDEELSGWNS